MIFIENAIFTFKCLMQNIFRFKKYVVIGLFFSLKNTSILQKICSLAVITHHIVTRLSLKQKKTVNSWNILNINVADQRDWNKIEDRHQV